MRQATPRSAHADWAPPRGRRDPLEVLDEQNETRVPALVPVRYGRMAPTPFTFFRGAAAVMAEDLAESPVSGSTTQLCGDAHAGNFGLFGTPERRLVFGCNDFDETLPGPWEWDVKRLAASLVIAARCTEEPLDAGARDHLGRAAVEACCSEYRERMAQFATMRTLDVWYSVVEVAASSRLSRSQQREVERLAARARRRDSLQALRKLAVEVDGRYQIRPDPPLVVPLDVDDAVRTTVSQVWSEYLESLEDERRVLLSRYRLCDVAHKVVGVGSVGTRCWIALLQGDGAAEGEDPLVLQLKEANPSVLERALGPSAIQPHGRRVVVGQRLMQAFPDIFLGWTTPRSSGRSYYVRQLRDMKGSVNLTAMAPTNFVDYGRACGWTLARSHARAGDPATIAGYLGRSDRFDRAIVEFARRYADQNEVDHEHFLQAVRDGRVPVTPENAD